MMANKLTQNLFKLNMILIQPKNLNNKVKPNIITYNFVTKISTVNSSKYLIILFDNSLMFKPQIKMLTNKLSKTFEILKSAVWSSS